MYKIQDFLNLAILWPNVPNSDTNNLLLSLIPIISNYPFNFVVEGIVSNFIKHMTTNEHNLTQFSAVSLRGFLTDKSKKCCKGHVLWAYECRLNPCFERRHIFVSGDDPAPQSTHVIFHLHLYVGCHWYYFNINRWEHLSKFPSRTLKHSSNISMRTCFFAVQSFINIH